MPWYHGDLSFGFSSTSIHGSVCVKAFGVWMSVGSCRWRDVVGGHHPRVGVSLSLAPRLSNYCHFKDCS
ncbi:hypothetical protein ACOMHN_039162 [Nucella lapillus]